METLKTSGNFAEMKLQESLRREREAKKHREPPPPPRAEFGPPVVIKRPDDWASRQMQTIYGNYEKAQELVAMPMLFGVDFDEPPTPAPASFLRACARNRTPPTPEDEGPSSSASGTSSQSDDAHFVPVPRKENWTVPQSRGENLSRCDNTQKVKMHPSSSSRSNNSASVVVSANVASHQLTSSSSSSSKLTPVNSSSSSSASATLTLSKGMSRTVSDNSRTMPSSTLSGPRAPRLSKMSPDGQKPVSDRIGSDRTASSKHKIAGSEDEDGSLVRKKLKADNEVGVRRDEVLRTGVTGEKGGIGVTGTGRTGVMRAGGTVVTGTVVGNRVTGGVRVTGGDTIAGGARITGDQMTGSSGRRGAELTCEIANLLKGCNRAGIEAAGEPCSALLDRSKNCKDQRQSLSHRGSALVPPSEHYGSGLERRGSTLEHHGRAALYNADHCSQARGELEDLVTDVLQELSMPDPISEILTPRNDCTFLFNRLLSSSSHSDNLLQLAHVSPIDDSDDEEDDDDDDVSSQAPELSIRESAFAPTYTTMQPISSVGVVGDNSSSCLARDLDLSSDSSASDNDDDDDGSNEQEAVDRSSEQRTSIGRTRAEPAAEMSTTRIAAAACTAALLSAAAAAEPTSRNSSRGNGDFGSGAAVTAAIKDLHKSADSPARRMSESSTSSSESDDSSDSDSSDDDDSSDREAAESKQEENASTQRSWSIQHFLPKEKQLVPPSFIIPDAELTPPSLPSTNKRQRHNTCSSKIKDPGVKCEIGSHGVNSVQKSSRDAMSPVCGNPVPAACAALSSIDHDAELDDSFLHDPLYNSMAGACSDNIAMDLNEVLDSVIHDDNLLKLTPIDLPEIAPLTYRNRSKDVNINPVTKFSAAEIVRESCKKHVQRLPLDRNCQDFGVSFVDNKPSVMVRINRSLLSSLQCCLEPVKKKLAHTEDKKLSSKKKTSSSNKVTTSSSSSSSLLSSSINLSSSVPQSGKPKHKDSEASSSNCSDSKPVIESKESFDGKCSARKSDAFSPGISMQISQKTQSCSQDDKLVLQCAKARENANKLKVEMTLNNACVQMKNSEMVRSSVKRSEVSSEDEIEDKMPTTKKIHSTATPACRPKSLIDTSRFEKGKEQKQDTAQVKTTARISSSEHLPPSLPHPLRSVSSQKVNRTAKITDRSADRSVSSPSETSSIRCQNSMVDKPRKSSKASDPSAGSQLAVVIGSGKATTAVNSACTMSTNLNTTRALLNSPATSPDGSLVDALRPSVADKPLDRRKGCSDDKTSSFPTLPADFSDKLETKEFYYQEARRLKHQGESETNKFERLLFHLESTMSFIAHGFAQVLDGVNPARIQQMYQDTLNLHLHVCRTSAIETCDNYHKDTIMALSLRLQSIIYQRLFELKKSEASKQKTVLEAEIKNPTMPFQLPSPYHAGSVGSQSLGQSTIAPVGWSHVNGTLSPISPIPQPSPASSVASIPSVGSSNGGESGLVKPVNGITTVVSSMLSSVVIPQRIHSMMISYFGNIINLHQSTELWEQSNAIIHDHSRASEFFDRMEKEGFHLDQRSSLTAISRYFKIALLRLRTE